MTIEDIELSLLQSNTDERRAVFLLAAKYLADDLMVEADQQEGQLALKCLKAATSGKKITSAEVIKLASALGVGTEELNEVLKNLSVKKPNGKT